MAKWYGTFASTVVSNMFIEMLKKHIERCRKAPNSVKSTNDGQNPLIIVTPSVSSTGSEVLPPATPTCTSLSKIHLVDIGETSAPKKQKLSSPYFDTMSESEQVKLARAIYASGCPLHLTTNKHWKRLFQVIRPAYTVPSRYMLSNNLLDSEYYRVQEKVKETTDNSDCLCIVISDGWSNIRNEGLINFLLTTPLPVFLKSVDTNTNKHTGAYIGDQIKSVIKESGPTKVFAIITDNAMNMKAAWEVVRTTYPHIVTIGCSAHGLNLLLGDICELITLDNLIKKSKKLIKTIKHKHILNAMFIKKQKESKLSYALKLPGRTRWGAVVIMFQSLVNGKASLQSMAITEELENDLDADTRSLILDNDVFWKRITLSIKLLNPIVDGITIVEGDKTTLSHAVKVLHDIEKKMEENLAESILSKGEEIKVKNFVKARRKFMIQPAHYAACIVDPNIVGKELSE